MILRLVILSAMALGAALAGDGVEVSSVPHGQGKSPEDNIPVIEIKGEGKPMTAAQIRALEEATDGPQDIKVKNTWKPSACLRKAKRKDFITIQYKGFLESGKKFHQSYGNDGPIRLQLGTGMIMPGLDKAMKGMCAEELRKVSVPWRLSRKRKSKQWKYIPNEEHWLVFDVEMLSVEEWTPELQFEFMDHNNDTFLTIKEITKHIEMTHKQFGKHWHNEDIDNVNAATYFIRYFDADGDDKVTKSEYAARMHSDMAKMAASGKKGGKGRKRDPDVAWILDFNNDGLVDPEEMDAAAERLESPPPPRQEKHEEL